MRICLVLALSANSTQQSESFQPNGEAHRIETVVFERLLLEIFPGWQGSDGMCWTIKITLGSHVQKPASRRPDVSRPGLASILGATPPSRTQQSRFALDTALPVPCWLGSGSGMRIHIQSCEPCGFPSVEPEAAGRLVPTVALNPVEGKPPRSLDLSTVLRF